MLNAAAVPADVCRAQEGNHHIPILTVKGVVVQVIDAANMVVWTAEEQHRFTLYGVDLPGADTAKGKAAKKEVSDLVFNKLLTVHLYPGAPLQGIVVIQGNCLNRDLVKNGTATVGKECRMEPWCGAWRETR